MIDVGLQIPGKMKRVGIQIGFKTKTVKNRRTPYPCHSNYGISCIVPQALTIL